MAVDSSGYESRLRVVLAVFITGLGLLWVRLFYLQVIRGENLRVIAEANRTSLVFERAPRGLVLDRNGQVWNVRTYGSLLDLPRPEESNLLECPAST